MTKKRLGGYSMRAEITRAINANRLAREALRRMIDEEPRREMILLLAGKAAVQLGTNLEALREIEQILDEAIQR